MCSIVYIPTGGKRCWCFFFFTISSVVFILKYVLLQLLAMAERWSIPNATKEMYKFDRCLFGWSYFPVWISIPYDMLRNEMIKGKKQRPQRFFLLVRLIVNKREPLQIRHYMLCLLSTPSNEHTYAHNRTSTSWLLSQCVTQRNTETNNYN